MTYTHRHLISHPYSGLQLLKEGSDLIYIRFESFCEGNDYVGRKAARDDAFVTNLHEGILKNWPHPQHGFKYVEF